MIMQIPKIRLPQDLSTLFTLIRDKAFSTAKYLANLIKQYSLALYSSLEHAVDRLKPNRVTVLNTQKFVIIERTTKPAVNTNAPIQEEASPKAVEVQVDPKIEIPAADPSIIKELPKYPLLSDISVNLSEMALSKVPDLESSVQKMIQLAREVFETPIENNPELNRKLLDPFHTSVTSED
jgi:hypothetical protein